MKGCFFQVFVCLLSWVNLILGLGEYPAETGIINQPGIRCPAKKVTGLTLLNSEIFWFA